MVLQMKRAMQYEAGEWVGRVVVGVDDFRGEGIAHRDALAGAGGGHDPAEGERFLALKGDFHRDLVGGATDAAALHLEAGAGVFQRAQQQVDRVALLQLLGDLLKGSVDDALGKVLLAPLHDHIDEVRDQGALVADIGLNLTLLGSVAA
jgi:hypothetical protein